MTAPPLPSAPPSREGFVLRGRSVPLDPRTHAVRADLADIRLAEYVFAPHYVAPLARTVAAETILRAGRDADAEALATLSPGDMFEVLEFAGGDAWGIASDTRCVGYIPADALAAPA